jgi:hypothetical protein
MNIESIFYDLLPPASMSSNAMLAERLRAPITAFDLVGVGFYLVGVGSGRRRFHRNGAACVGNESCRGCVHDAGTPCEPLPDGRPCRLIPWIESWRLSGSLPSWPESAEETMLRTEKERTARAKARHHAREEETARKQWRRARRSDLYRLLDESTTK